MVRKAPVPDIEGFDYMAEYGYQDADRWDDDFEDRKEMRERKKKQKVARKKERESKQPRKNSPKQSKTFRFR